MRSIKVKRAWLSNIRRLGLVFLLFLAIPAWSQNTKGDQPVDNQRQIREMRGKSVIRKQRATRDISGRKLRTKNASSSSRANYPQPNPYEGRRVKGRADRAARPLGRIFNSSPRTTQQPWSGDITGRKLRVQEEARKGLKKADKPFVYTRTPSGQKPVQIQPRVEDRAWKGAIDGSPVRSGFATRNKRNSYSKNSGFTRFLSRLTRSDNRPVSNRATISINSKLSSSYPSGSRGRIASQSTSGGFFQRGRRNVYWGKFSKGETAITRDISGRRLRQRNFRSPFSGLVGTDSLGFLNRNPSGERAYRGRVSGGFMSGKGGQAAWRGDISGQPLRHTNPSKKTEIAGLFGGKRLNRSGRIGNEPLPPKAPGIGAIGINQFRGTQKRRLGFDTGGTGFSGFIKARKPSKGGGSISGAIWNNNGSPIGVRRSPLRVGSYSGNVPLNRAGNFRSQGEGFSGFIKARRPAQGGGSISGGIWNNNSLPIAVRRSALRVGSYSGNIPAGRIGNFRAQGEEFSGFIRTDRSGNFREQGEEFSGFIKARRPAKGGGSVSGFWNNNGSPIGVRTPSSGALKAGNYAGNIRTDRSGNFREQGEEFSGFIKARRPAKGGGSVSGFWNNNGSPIGVRTPSSGALKAGTYAGNIRTDRSGDFREQGEEFSGFIKARRPEKGGGSISGVLWNNSETPIEVRSPKKGLNADTYSGNLKQTRTSKSDEVNYPGRIRRPLLRNDYVQSPEASKESLKKNNPYASNSAQEFFRDLFSAKATANVGAYQGNTKMRKYNNAQLHPDAQFAHSDRDNVDEERTLFMDIQLLWSKMFRSTQPSHLSDESEKPRYDKGEQGLWYD